jgi:hypothetical protein
MDWLKRREDFHNFLLMKWSLGVSSLGLVFDGTWIHFRGYPVPILTIPTPVTAPWGLFKKSWFQFCQYEFFHVGISEDQPERHVIEQDENHYEGSS